MENAAQADAHSSQACDGLVVHVRGLPQDLIDCIQSFALELRSLQSRTVAGEVQPITVDSTWRAPSMLQVNGTVREAAAEVYYGSNIFKFLDSADQAADCARWLEALCPSHAAEITNIRIRVPEGSQLEPLDCSGLQIRPRGGHPGYTADEHMAETVLAQNIILLHPGHLLAKHWPVWNAAHATGWRRVAYVMHSELRFTINRSDRVYGVWLPAVGAHEKSILKALRTEVRRQAAIDALEVERLSDGMKHLKIA